MKNPCFQTDSVDFFVALVLTREMFTASLLKLDRNSNSPSHSPSHPSLPHLENTMWIDQSYLIRGTMSNKRKQNPLITFQLPLPPSLEFVEWPQFQIEPFPFYFSAKFLRLLI